MHRNGDLKGENNMPQNKGPFYMTTAIAYTSGKPHIGNTYEIVLQTALQDSEDRKDMMSVSRQEPMNTDRRLN